MQIEVPKFTTSKNALLYAYNPDSENMLIAWRLDDGKIISFERLPGDYPPVSMVVFPDDKEFATQLRYCWITKEDIIKGEFPL